MLCVLARRLVQKPLTYTRVQASRTVAVFVANLGGSSLPPPSGMLTPSPTALRQVGTGSLWLHCIASAKNQ